MSRGYVISVLPWQGGNNIWVLKSVTIQMKATEQYFPVVQYIML